MLLSIQLLLFTSSLYKNGRSFIVNAETRKKTKKKKHPPPSLIGRPVMYSTHGALFPETKVIAQHLVSKTFPGGTLSSQPINHYHYENLIKH